MWRTILAASLLLLASCKSDVKVHTSTDSTTAAAHDTARTPVPVPERRDTIRDTVTHVDTVTVDHAQPKQGNITVTSPARDEGVGRTFKLEGTARTFENGVSYRVVGNDGATIAEGHLTARGEMGNFNPYSATVTIKRSYKGPARLEVYQASAKDGSEIDKVMVPIVIGSEGTGAQSVRLFFTNGPRGNGADCEKVFPIERTINRTPAVAEAALKELLKGPTPEEHEAGFGTEIPEKTRLKRIKIDGTTARVDFNGALNKAAGSCRVTAIRSQIERTLRQFPTISSVEITVDGKSRGVLQP